MGERRPIAARELGVSKRLAHRLATAGWTANGISVAGMLAGVLAGVVLASTSFAPATARWAFLAAAMLVQVRLLANMLDGMVALESGQASPLGEMYNEVPDRVADIAVLTGLGYAAGGAPIAGLAAAVGAVLTAYVRAQAAVAGAPQDFCGPMAKPHRVFLVTVAALYCALAPAAAQPVTEQGWGVAAACAVVVAVGSLVTVVRRLRRSAKALRR